MPTSLQGIANRARREKKARFRHLYSMLNESNLKWCFYQLRKDAAAGIDKVTYVQYEEHLEENLKGLVERLKRKKYHAKLVRRKYIPKGKGKKRPLGIPVLEDKLLQLAVAKMLSAIYEVDFLDMSWGYRPGRGAREASRVLSDALIRGKFGLEVAPEKTRRLRFSRFDLEPNEAFEFLGFEFRWVLSRKGKPRIQRRTSPKKLTQSMGAFTDWIKKNRHQRITTLMGTLRSKFRGYWNYYGVQGNYKSMHRFWRQALKVLFTWLNRRSHRRSYTWVGFFALLRDFAIPGPRIVESRIRQLHFTLSAASVRSEQC